MGFAGAALLKEAHLGACSLALHFISVLHNRMLPSHGGCWMLDAIMT